MVRQEAFFLGVLLWQTLPFAAVARPAGEGMDSQALRPAQQPQRQSPSPSPDPSPPPPPPPGPGLDDGLCSDPSISWKAGPGNGTESAYVINNQIKFPHGASVTLDPLMVFICNRLVSPCNAPRFTVDTCYASERQVWASGLTGQAAADLWNELMG
ncbi:hypothetical protein BO71DRAFT_481696 [Aspergillus ellipticus CBS 707.79]|uniref:Uncharacterized protein n=1 Tax=Aspergillus ellipticus CBS 707.79 TaxID=1448320 RepID=A0A319DHE6_9EURO|nr:hypothetical protein BO71DRAFT_481696 [Aspergillus ellipticus CBS 707.79]